MAKIINLEIKNFRGIQTLSLDFKPDSSLICFIGRGDSGKTTILDAISFVLSPSWNLTFSDTDFYNCNPNQKIEITASVINFPDKLLLDNKYGLNVRAYDFKNHKIIDNLDTEEVNGSILPLLSIKLIVDSSLEPNWFVYNMREQDDKTISAKDRSLLNCFLISDYIDRHFSWNRGTPLNSLLKLGKKEDDEGNSNIVIDYLRKAKKEIDNDDFDKLTSATALVKEQAAKLGLDISGTDTTLDSKELLIRDGRVSLHDKSIPFRLKGKGSKRLTSLAIQSILVRSGGIMLIDEIEQGLEPDRIKQAVRSLEDNNSGQIFMTTHSRDAITELGVEPLVYLKRNDLTDEVKYSSFDIDNKELQKTVRACPEAFFSKKVIICEGATEVGICRALDKWRLTKNEPQMSFMNCSYVDGTGSTIAQRVTEINQVGIDTALFCDSDLLTINSQKNAWKEVGVSIFDCEEDLCLEQQLFTDIPWSGAKKLLQYAKEQNVDSFSTLFSDLKDKPISEWEDNAELRARIIEIFKPDKKGKTKRDWFKKIHHGEFVGEVIFSCFDDFSENNRLKNTIMDMSKWIDKGTL